MGRLFQEVSNSTGKFQRHTQQPPRHHSTNVHQDRDSISAIAGNEQTDTGKLEKEALDQNV